ncbi:hypothetical protein GOP47_0020417 [Adiantum capillus-veneris]|uniref:ENTH domain-containing protein n=1 Tax=Adiantum capillus-veneris TaxID=13818 RepID=A0A9D4Z9J5_ADICA|nr:hypothetical protein GOP47_0020417 [Adiantum capillus-veneris]
MAPLQQTLRRALGSVKDQTSIGIAKVSSNGAPELEVALVKATSHDEAPIEEKYVQEIIHLTSFSRGYVSACVAGIAKRLGKTHNWVVAIKALMLTHRLLREGDSSVEQELLYHSRHGMRVLNLSNFRDDSYSHAWDYSAFVRTYAMFLDEKLEFNLVEAAKGAQLEDGGRRRGSTCDSYDGRRDDGYGDDARRDEGVGNDGRRYDDYGPSWRDDEYSHGYGAHHRENGFSHGKVGKDQGKKISSVKDMSAKDLLGRIPLMQRLVERVLACRPTGAARMHRLVQVALYPVVRESFQLYTDISDGLAIVLDAFFEMDHVDCVKAFDIYSKATKQIDELASFYKACKDLGVCRSSEYPVVQRISEELLETMEDFLRDRSERNRRKKSPEPQPRSPEPIADDTSYDVNGMKALPAPPVSEEPEPEPPVEIQDLRKEESQGDLLEFDNEPVSAEEHGDRLALALFSDTAGTSTTQGSQTSYSVSLGERPLAGWELALVESSSEISKPATNPLAGGFNNLLLTSMYEQGSVNQKVAASIPSGSASSVALPGRLASSYLALPAPVGAQLGDDPFAASVTVPPPPYVQMDDMRQKQQLLVQEQQTWYRYQHDGMQGYNGLMKFHNPGYGSSLRSYQPVPYYGSSYY